MFVNAICYIRNQVGLSVVAAFHFIEDGNSVLALSPVDSTATFGVDLMTREANAHVEDPACPDLRMDAFVINLCEAHCVLEEQLPPLPDNIGGSELIYESIGNS